MTKYNDLFAGELNVRREDRFSDVYQIGDTEYMFADIHDVMAHDDGKAKQRAEYIANAVNQHEKLQEALEFLHAQLGTIAHKQDRDKIKEIADEFNLSWF